MRKAWGYLFEVMNSRTNTPAGAAVRIAAVLHCGACVVAVVVASPLFLLFGLARYAVSYPWNDNGREEQDRRLLGDRFHAGCRLTTRSDGKRR